MVTSNDARLGFQVESAGLAGVIPTLERILGVGTQVGNMADQTSARLSQMGRGGAQPLSAAATDLRTAAEQLQRARAALPADWDRLDQKARTRWTFANQGAFDNYATARAQFDAATAASRSLGNQLDLTANRMSFLGGAAGALAGVFAYQLIGSVGNLVTEFARLPAEMARAQDALLTLDTQLRFAFRGSADAARRARADIVELALSAGIPYNQLAAQYADTAVSGRSAGLSRRQTTSLVQSVAYLGALTNADNGRIGRANWQLQQALSVGYLSGQDYRLLASNLPAIDDALAAGLNVDPSRIMGMASRGEIDTQRLMSIIAGVRTLAEDAGGLPRTMERSGARLQTQWQLLLEEMGEDINASGIAQSWTDALTAVVASLRTPAGRQGLSVLGSAVGTVLGVPTQAGVFFDVPEYDQAPGDKRPGLDRISQELAEERRAKVRAAILLATEGDTLAAQRVRVGADIARLETGLAQPEMPAADRANVERYRDVLAAQLERMLTPLERFVRDTANAAHDLEQYGPGAGLQMAQRARALIDQSVNAGDLIDMPAALQAQFGQALFEARQGTAQSASDLVLRRQFLLPAAGLSRLARSRAQADYDTERFAQSFGPFANDNAAQGEVAAFRAQRQDELDYENDTAIAERAAADVERLRSMREQLTLTERLGERGRINLALLQREQELRRAGVQLTKEQNDLEEARVVMMTRLNEELDLQSRQFSLLLDAAQTAGTTITNVFSTAIYEGIRTGSVRAETVLDALTDSLARIADNLLRSLMAPFERRATNFFEGFLDNFLGGFFGGGGGGGPTPTIATKGSAFGNVIAFGFGGGVRSTPQLFPMANGMGLWGEAGDEAILPLKRDSGGRLGVISSGGAASSAGVQINIIDQRSGDAAPVETQESTGADGRRMIEVFVRDQTDKNLRSGKHNAAMATQFGASPRIKRA